MEDGNLAFSLLVLTLAGKFIYSVDDTLLHGCLKERASPGFWHRQAASSSSEVLEVFSIRLG